MRAVTLLYRHGSEHRRPEPHPNSHPPPRPRHSRPPALPTDHHLSAGATALSRLSAGPSARRPDPPHPRVQNRSGSPRWCMAGSSSPPRRGAAHLRNRRAGRLLHDHGPSGPPPNRGSTARCPTKRGPRSPRLPETVTDQIVALYVDEQLSAPAIGRITCLAVSTVRRTLDRNGVTRRHDRSRGEGRRTAAHFVEQLVAIYQADDRISVAEASSRVGVGLSAGSWILKQHGIVARTSALVQRAGPDPRGQPSCVTSWPRMGSPVTHLLDLPVLLDLRALDDEEPVVEAAASAHLTQPRNASGWMSSWPAIRAIAPRRVDASRRASTASRVTRSFSSSGYFPGCRHNADPSGSSASTKPGVDHLTHPGSTDGVRVGAGRNSRMSF